MPDPAEFARRLVGAEEPTQSRRIYAPPVAEAGMPFVRVFRINAVGKEGRAIVLGTADTAAQALNHIRDAFGDYPRAWVTDEEGDDVPLSDLMRMADEEEKGGSVSPDVQDGD